MKKHILITGSTDGIGKLLAKKLAHDGHTVYVHGRNPEKLNATISEIKETTNNPNIDGFIADLSSFEAVKQLADNIKEKVPVLDVIINNAGVYNSNKPHNSDGVDMRFAVNYMAPYVLTEALLPLLRETENSRIINLSSAAQATVNIDTLTGKTEESERATYAQSKLALTMWSFYLAQQEPNLNVIAVNPGSLLDTKMVHKAFGKVWSPAEKGVDILYDLALSESHKNASGTYFDNDRGDFGEAHRDAYNSYKISELITNTNQLILSL